MLTGQKNEVQQGSGAIEPHLELKRGFDVSRARPGKKSGRYFPDRTLQVNSIAGTGSKKVSDKTCITPFLKNNIMHYLIPVILFLNLTVCCMAGEKELILAADPWCPYNCEEGNEPSGYLVDLAKEIYQQHGYTVKYINLPWARALRYAKEGAIHAAIGAVKGNRGDLHLNNEILGKDETVIVVRKGETFPFEEISSLDGKRIGVIKDYTYDNHGAIDTYIAERQKNKNSNLYVLHNQEALESLFKMLSTNRIDLFFENKNVTYYKAGKLGLSNQIEIIETGKGDEIFFAFTPDTQGRKLAGILDHEMRELKKSERFKKLLDRYGLPQFE